MFKDILNQKVELIGVLEKLKIKHQSLADRLLQADNGKIYPLDFLYVGLLQRSISTIKGFLTEIESDNYLCAAPLIRIHLDTLLQVYAAFVVENPHEYATKKLEGICTNHIKAKDGKLLQDSYIIKLMNNDLRLKSSWVKDLYSETSKFIHASDKHIFSTVTKGKKEGEVLFTISENLHIPDESIVSGLLAMIEITNLVIRLWEGWIVTKSASSPNSSAN